MLHLSKIALDNGGTIVPLIIPSEETNQTGLCNPSIYVDGDDILVNIRNVGYTLQHSIGAKHYKDEGGKFHTRWGPLSYLHPEQDRTLRTNNFLGFLDSNLNLINNFKVDTTKLDIEPNWEFIGLEDARIVRWDNKLYLTGVRRDVHPDGQGRMELSEIYITPKKVQEISRCRIEVPFESYCDKNWMPILDMPYHYVRWSNPLEIMKVDPVQGTSEIVQKSDDFLDVSWNEGHQEPFSGSSQVIPWDNGCRLAVIHECQWWRWTERDPSDMNSNKDGRYKHRILLWDRDWNLIKYTDPFTFMDGQIEFCCGATTIGNDLVISFGFQDNAAYLLKINKDVINNLFKNNIKTTHELVTYNKEDYYKLRLKFNGSEKIEKNYSQVGQDLFVLHMLDGKKNGTYLEVGSGRPFYGNNTFLLEKLGWYGVGIELYEPFLEKYKFNRKNKVFGIDALTINYNQFLNENFTTKNIDYLQLDIDPAQNTFDVLKSIPFNTYKFAVITYEHDHYQDTTSIIRTESRKYLESFGYELVVSNISPDENSPFEDWWVHPDLVDINRINNAKFLNKDVVDIKDYMFVDNQWSITDWPTMEITTSVPKKGCVVDCVFCPQEILKKSYEGDRFMTMEEFKMSIDKLPIEIRITFSGFVEPWMNKHCSDMLLYAHNKGHRISVFTTAIGMSLEDVEKIKDVSYCGGPNGGFVLHLPDNENLAKHPITDKYIDVLEAIKNSNITNFSTMSMGKVHDSVKHLFNNVPTHEMWSRAGNLMGEAQLKPELLNVMDRVKSTYRNKDTTCGCVEDLYHNILLPNGDVSLCCMDYGLDNILGNLYKDSYENIIPKQNTCFEICKNCENGVDPR